MQISTVRRTLSAITLGAGILLAGSATAQKHINGGDSTEVNGNIVTHLAGHTLTIPKGYVSSFMGFANNLMLKAMLPCLVPETPENSAEFHKVSFSKILTINLNPFSDAAYRVGQEWLDVHLNNTKSTLEWLKQNQPDHPNLTADTGPTPIPGSKFIAYRDLLLSRDVYVLPNTDPLFLFDCTHDSNECSVHERFGDFYMWYWFDRSFVENDIDNAWVIERRVRELLTSFLTNTKHAADCR